MTEITIIKIIMGVMLPKGVFIFISALKSKQGNNFSTVCICVCMYICILSYFMTKPRKFSFEVNRSLLLNSQLFSIW